ncbi:MAG TPA: trehalose-phosphatase [Afifellaceae bacterium]|nr:trehalose-phosphatase [Afifellaceae bacterium]
MPALSANEGDADQDSFPLPLEKLEFELPGKSLYLDFDGTLVGIAPTPESIEIPSGLPRRLEALQQALDGAVAIVTGREISDIEKFLPGFSGPVAGGHGSHMRTIDGRYVTSEIDPEPLRVIQREIAAYAQSVDGLLAENKTAGCVLHYRQVPDAAMEAHRFVDALIGNHDGFVTEAAKMAIEVRPESVTKAGALASIASSTPFSGRVPAYAGDDISDEPAFRWVNDRGGVSIRVGEGPTSAHYGVPSVTEFAGWIDSVLSTFTARTDRVTEEEKP